MILVNQNWSQQFEFLKDFVFFLKNCCETFNNIIFPQLFCLNVLYIYLGFIF